MNNNKQENSIFKHIDFVVADILILQLAFFIATKLYSKGALSVVNYGTAAFRREQLVLLATVLLSLEIENPYKNILKRNKWQEMAKMFQHTLMLAMINIVVLFVIHDIGITFRIVTGNMWIIYFIAELSFHLIWKKIIRNYVTGHKAANRQIVICTTRAEAEKTVFGLLSKDFLDYDIRAIFLSDYDKESDCSREISGYEVLGNIEDMFDFATHNWTDEVVLNLPNQVNTVK